MDISPIIAFFNARHKTYQHKVDARKSLSSLVAEYGKTAVTKAIRKEYGKCPYIVPVFEKENEWFFSSFLHKGRYKGEKVYSTEPWATSSKYAYIYRGGIGYFCDAEDNYPMAGATLLEWIIFGEECPDCGTPFLNADNFPVCSKCMQSYRLHEYHAKAEDILETEETKDLLMGVELEYEEVRVAHVTAYLKRHAIAKKDGTIHDGVEVVTRPACLATHKKALQPFYESVKTQAAPNTGMHVHVEKKKLTNYQIGFMLQFLNATHLVKPLEIVAGRDYTSNTYTRPKPDTTMYTGMEETEDGLLFRSPTNKYSPLNTRKDNTVEVRIFSSPKTYEECCAKLDFVKGLVDYASPYSISTKTLKEKFEWKTFLSFMQQNKKEFSHFHSFFIKENKFEGIA